MQITVNNRILERKRRKKKKKKAQPPQLNGEVNPRKSTKKSLPCSNTKIREISKAKKYP